MGNTKSKEEEQTISRVDHNVVNNGDARTQSVSAHFVLTLITLLIVLCAAVIIGVRFAVRECTKRVVKAIQREAIESANPKV